VGGDALGSDEHGHEGLAGEALRILAVAKRQGETTAWCGRSPITGATANRPWSLQEGPDGKLRKFTINSMLQIARHKIVRPS
jgi:hypothetical protein